MIKYINWALFSIFKHQWRNISALVGCLTLLCLLGCAPKSAPDTLPDVERASIQDTSTQFARSTSVSQKQFATAKPRLTNTNRPTHTSLPTYTDQPTHTSQPIYTDQPTLSPPTNTPAEQSATPQTVSNESETYHTRERGNVRACTSTTCSIVTTLTTGVTLQVMDQNMGERVSGSDLWYKIQVDGKEGYIHSSLVAQGTPPAQPIQPTQASAPSQLVIATPIEVISNESTGLPLNTSLPPVVISTAVEQPPALAWTCTGNLYNCSDFSDRNTLMSYFNVCPGDPSGLDSDNDGYPCESLQ